MIYIVVTRFIYNCSLSLDLGEYISQGVLLRLAAIGEVRIYVNSLVLRGSKFIHGGLENFDNHLLLTKSV